MRIVHVIARLNVGGAALSRAPARRTSRRSADTTWSSSPGRSPPGEESMEYVADDLGVP